MTIKLPPRGQRSGPIYQAIADAIGREIEAGRLKPGSRLPTQRVLARQLGVTLTTVTRAYVEAQRRGLLSGEVGRGTFVRPSALEIEGPEHGVLDLAVNALMPLPYMEELADRLGRGGSAIGRRAHLRLSASRGRAAQPRRGLGVDWLDRPRGADRSRRRDRRRPARDSAVADGAGEARRRDSRRGVHLSRGSPISRRICICACGPSRSIAKASCPESLDEACRDGQADRALLHFVVSESDGGLHVGEAPPGDCRWWRSSIS